MDRALPFPPLSLIGLLRVPAEGVQPEIPEEPGPGLTGAEG